MIYTLTFNPSLDYIISMKDFELGKTNRTTEELMLAGGKGINVSTVLKNLGIESTALGFVAGFVGEEIERKTRAEGLCCDFIHSDKGCSRINVKMKEFDGTEINGMGPVIDEKAMGQLMDQLRGIPNIYFCKLDTVKPACAIHFYFSNSGVRLTSSGCIPSKCRLR